MLYQLLLKENILLLHNMLLNNYAQQDNNIKTLKKLNYR